MTDAEQAVLDAAIAYVDAHRAHHPRTVMYAADPPARYMPRAEYRARLDALMAARDALPGAVRP